MTVKNERLLILELIDNGTITPEDGARLLIALSGISKEETNSAEKSAGAHRLESETPVEQSGPSTVSADQVESESGARVDADPEVLDAPFKQPDVDMWRRWWIVPLWIGVCITVIGGSLMYASMQAGGANSFWFVCAWLPFLLGIAVIVLAWGSRNASWIHIRVRQRPGERPQTIAISFPIPIRLTAWFLRNFGHYIPNLEHTGLDEIILALGDKTSPETPFYVKVDEGEDDEKIEIYIG